MDRFDKKLPEKNDFYSILQDEHTSDEQCKHVQNVWQTFNLKTTGE